MIMVNNWKKIRFLFYTKNETLSFNYLIELLSSISCKILYVLKIFF